MIIKSYSFSDAAKTILIAEIEEDNILQTYTVMQKPGDTTLVYLGTLSYNMPLNANLANSIIEIVNTALIAAGETVQFSKIPVGGGGGGSDAQTLGGKGPDEFIQKDGSILMRAGYSPLQPLQVATKEYVDKSIDTAVTEVEQYTDDKVEEAVVGQNVPVDGGLF